jgi:hypothetical protein
MHRSRAPSIAPDTFFAQSWADSITDMPGFNLRQAQLPELTYRAAVEQFGQHGAAELSYLIGLYCMVSVTLNTFDVPIPES